MFCHLAPIAVQAVLVLGRPPHCKLRPQQTDTQTHTQVNAHELLCYALPEKVLIWPEKTCRI